jgi:hypothetical protein
LEVSEVTYRRRYEGKNKGGMSLNGISRTAKVVGTGVIFLAVLVGMQFYIVREVLAELMFFCMLFIAMEIVVVILFGINEARLRSLLWFKAHIALANLHLQHATVVSVAKPVIQSRASTLR